MIEKTWTFEGFEHVLKITLILWKSSFNENFV